MPWKSKKTGNCLDDDSCDTSNPFEEQLVGGTWYCYGKSKNEDWDCSQTEDGSKVVAVQVTTRNQVYDEPLAIAETQPADQHRAEMKLNEELITNNAVITAVVEPVPGDLLSYPDDAYAIQLIALETIEEATRFASDHDIDMPNLVRIQSQGSDWYVLILDIFGDQDTADQVAAAWNAEHNPSSKPWVRKLGPLKRAAALASGN
jgi:septal ring-binding cell division protein DamX